MEVILLERVEKLGQMGQVVNVKPGYARNYLLPKRKAMRATKENLAFFESQRTQLEAANLDRRKDAEQVARTLDGLTVVITRQAAETGMLYGSVSARDIAEAVTEAGFTIGRGQIAIEQPIKTLGIFKVRVNLHPEVSVAITVNVARSLEEAEMQARRGGMVTAADLIEEDEEEEAEAAEAVEVETAEEQEQA